jgi:hypothetical protein
MSFLWGKIKRKKSRRKFKEKGRKWVSGCLEGTINTKEAYRVCDG